MQVPKLVQVPRQVQVPWLVQFPRDSLAVCEACVRAHPCPFSCREEGGGFLCVSVCQVRRKGPLSPHSFSERRLTPLVATSVRPERFWLSPHREEKYSNN